MTISISRALLNRILADAAKDSGAERCGLLLGEAARICDVRFAANVAPEPACHFELDPAVLLDAHRTARNGGSRVVGHYHSHPSGKAVPSSIDAECAAPDGSLWLIVADAQARLRSEEHTSELQSLMRISYAVFCLKKKRHYVYH